MPADTSVKFLHSAMTGAPVMSGTAGALLTVLDACLINGWGTGNVDSIVVSGGVATVTRASGHPFEPGSVALIEGVTPSVLNGEKKVISTTTTTYTFDATGVADGAASGTMTHKLAPLGWAKPFSGTNLGAYKSSDPASTGCILRIDDTNAQNARVVGYETMSDINTGIGPFPASTQLSGGGYWIKSNADSTASRNWMLIGDGRFFLLMIAYSTVNLNAYGNYAYFGDFVASKTPDAYACVLGAPSSNISASGSIGAAGYDLLRNEPIGASVFSTAPRSYTGVGGAIAFHWGYPTFDPGETSYSRSGESIGAHIRYPNPTDGGLYLTIGYFTEYASKALRGTIPGVYYCPQSVGTGVFNTRDSVTGVAGLPGKTLKAVPTVAGVFFIDTTGPWR